MANTKFPNININKKCVTAPPIFRLEDTKESREFTVGSKNIPILMNTHKWQIINSNNNVIQNNHQMNVMENNPPLSYHTHLPPLQIRESLLPNDNANNRNLNGPRFRLNSPELSQDSISQFWPEPQIKLKYR